MQRTEEQRKRIAEATQQAMKHVNQDKLASNRGKHWYKDPNNLNDGLFLECPEGWVKGRYATGETGSNFGTIKNPPKKVPTKKECLSFDELRSDRWTADTHQELRMHSAKLLLIEKYNNKCQHCGKDLVLHDEKVSPDTAVLHHCLVEKKDGDQSYWKFDDIYEDGHYELLCFSCHRKLHGKVQWTVDNPSTWK
jgi:hypothetical protein